MGGGGGGGREGGRADTENSVDYCHEDESMRHSPVSDQGTVGKTAHGKEEKIMSSLWSSQNKTMDTRKLNKAVVTNHIHH